VLPLVRFDGLAAVPGLLHAVTTRAGGVSRGPRATLNLGRSVGDDPAAVAENRRRVAEALGASFPPRFPRQMHGARVVAAEEARGDDLGEADAVTCGSPGLLVGVLGADCPGVLLVDAERRALALAHAGWRGTVAGVVPAALSALVARHGADPARVRAAVGPGVCAARYEVGPEVADVFRASFAPEDGVVRDALGGRPHVDLAAAVVAQLVREGVPRGAIEVLGRCTLSEPHAFFSHRRDGEGTGRHALVAGWAP
jgi:YfiH family protein